MMDEPNELNELDEVKQTKSLKDKEGEGLDAEEFAHEFMRDMAHGDANVLVQPSLMTGRAGQSRQVKALKAVELNAVARLLSTLPKAKEVR